MNAALKIKILAELERKNADVFWKIKRAYSEQYSSNAAAYFSDKIREWAQNKIQASDETLERINSFLFPNLALCERELIIEMLYLEKETSVERFVFVIDDNIEVQKKEVLSFLQHFKSEAFVGDLSWIREDCAAWICGGDLEMANVILKKFSKPDGKRIYSALAHSVNRYLRLLKNNGAQPDEVSFECEGACIHIVVRHKHFKGIRDAIARLIPKRKQK